MAYKYPNLAAEVARANLDYGAVYSEIGKKFKKSNDTISNWLTGKAGKLPTSVAFAIRDAYFPTMSVDYLFNETPMFASEFESETVVPDSPPA